MHDIKDIRKNIEKYKKKFQERNLNFDTSEFNKIDNTNRDLIIKKETLEKEKKLLSKSKEKKNFEKSKSISNKLDKILLEQKKSQTQLDYFISNLPNIANDEVPIGKDEKIIS